MLELKNICVSFRSERQDKVFGHTRQQVLFDVSLNVKRGTCLGILGESGSGKSTMGRVLCGLLKPDSGEAILDGVSVYASRAGRRNLQNKLSVVFQDYTTSANPRFRVKDIIGEGLTVRERRERGRLERNKETAALLELVGLPADFADRFPHELSGGMRQRVGIAIALACNPELLIADEPTSALDVTIQAQVLALMNELKQRLEMSMLLITHDFGIIARMCDKVAVMYAGKIVESGTWDDMFLTKEHHPYTEGLFGAIPDINSHEHRLHPIPGVVADNTRVHEGCPFAGRCGRAEDICHTCPPEEYCSGTHVISCHLFGKGA